MGGGGLWSDHERVISRSRPGHGVVGPLLPLFPCASRLGRPISPSPAAASQVLALPCLALGLTLLVASLLVCVCVCVCAERRLPPHTPVLCYMVLFHSPLYSRRACFTLQSSPPARLGTRRTSHPCVRTYLLGYKREHTIGTAIVNHARLE